MTLRIAIDPPHSWQPVPQNVTRANVMNLTIDLEPNPTGNVGLRTFNAQGQEAGFTSVTLTAERVDSLRAQIIEVVRQQLEADVAAMPDTDPNTGEPLTSTLTLVNE